MSWIIVPWLVFKTKEQYGKGRNKSGNRRQIKAAAVSHRWWGSIRGYTKQQGKPCHGFHSSTRCCISTPSHHSSLGRRRGTFKEHILSLCLCNCCQHTTMQISNIGWYGCFALIQDWHLLELFIAYNVSSSRLLQWGENNFVKNLRSKFDLVNRAVKVLESCEVLESGVMLLGRMLSNPSWGWKMQKLWLGAHTLVAQCLQLCYLIAWRTANMKTLDT